MAEGGTLFLDEIDSLAPQVQAKLLRLIEERTYKPLGGDRFHHANIRIVAASNRDLDTLVAERRFRSDLYFRLNVLPLRLPPLRSRRRDIPLLARHFVPQLCAKAGVGRKALAPSALNKLANFDWPGNVRELVNVLQCSVVFCEGPIILASQIALPESGDVPPSTIGCGTFREARARTLDTFERTYLEALLRRHHGNVSHAAREAGKDRRVLGRLIKKHRIDRHAL
jgi:two-component system response regulator GlrR